MAVDGRGLEGRQAVGFQNLSGEGGGILFIDVFQRHDRVRFNQLLQLQGAHVHELRNVADGDRRVQFGVVFVAALNDPVVLHDDVQLIAVQIAPEVVFHGLVRELGEEVGVQGVVRAAHEMNFHGFVVLLGSRFGKGTGSHKAEREYQSQKGREFLHRGFLLLFFAPGPPGCIFCFIFTPNKPFPQ